MFAARCIGVSLAVFFLLYVMLSFAIARGWALAERLAHRLSARRSADLLFALRMLPLDSAPSGSAWLRWCWVCAVWCFSPMERAAPSLRSCEPLT